MASITSVISLFVLLLVTYSYAKPVEQKYVSTTPQNKWVTGSTAVEYGKPVTMQLLVDGESTGVPQIHNERAFKDFSSEQLTTMSNPSFTPRSVWESQSEEFTTSSSPSFTPRSVGGSSSEELTTSSSPSFTPRSVWESQSEEFTTSSSPSFTPRSVGGSSSEELTTMSSPNFTPRAWQDDSLFETTPSNQQLGVNQFSTSTMESSTAFDRRAIKPFDSQEVETSTPYYSGNQKKVTKNIEPSSSVNSFGKYTGLLPNGPSSTFKYQQFDSSSEQLTTQYPVKTQRLTQPVKIIPGKVTQTEVYFGTPSQQSYVTPSMNSGEVTKFPKGQKTSSPKPMSNEEIGY
jgi:hypothetical protein